MLTRRAFLVGGLAVSVPSLFLSPSWAKKHKTEAANGPHLLSKNDWPPPIAPSQVGVTDKGLCCFTDEFGRLALMDFRPKKNEKHSTTLLGKVSGLGKRVIDFRVSGSKGYALVSAESEAGENQLFMVGISLVITPQIVSRTLLDKFAEVTSVTSSPMLVCVAGTSANGEATIAIYSEVRGKGSEPSLLSNFTAAAPVIKLEISGRNLVALAGSQSSVLQCINVADARSPELRKSLPMNGDFTNMSLLGDTAVLAGIFDLESGKKSGNESYVAVKSVALSPIPHVVSQMQLDPLVSVADMSATKGRFLVLGDTSSDMTLVSMTVDKLGVLSRDRDNDPPRLGSPLGQNCRLALRDKTAYVASGWLGLKVVSLTPSGWKTTYDYTVPRYAASSIASWKNLVVLAGSDLRLYDIAQTSSPQLVSVTNLPSYSKNVVGAGSYLVCLLKETLTLRKMQNPKDITATLQITGNELCFDPVQQKVYVLQTSGSSDADSRQGEGDNGSGESKTAKQLKESEQVKQIKQERQKKHAKDAKGPQETTVTKIQTYSNSFVSEKTYKLPGAFSQASAHDGVLLLSNLNNIALFDVSKDEAQLIGSHHFENLALRHGLVTKDHVLLTAVDQSSNGFFLVLARDDKDMKVLGTTDIPNDARALAAAKGKAVVIGQREGKDSAVVVDYRSDSAPHVVATVAGVEEAAAVTISEEAAIVGGRGLEILSLS